MKPRAIILSGYGLNCEDETAFAFRTAGAEADIVHINELSPANGGAQLKKYQILAVPGGFSFGDDTGSGKAFAYKLKQALGDQLYDFLARDTLMIGICNGFQILTNAGILPGALTCNDSGLPAQAGRYQSEWVGIVATSSISPWLAPSPPYRKGGNEGEIDIPIAHGEGKYIIDQKRPPTIAFRYLKNPNGSVDDIAGILGYDGRVLGMMPHPERAQFPWQQPPGSREKGGQGLQIFKNAVRYFR